MSLGHPSFASHNVYAVCMAQVCREVYVWVRADRFVGVGQKEARIRICTSEVARQTFWKKKIIQSHYKHYIW